MVIHLIHSPAHHTQRRSDAVHRRQAQLRYLVQLKWKWPHAYEFPCSATSCAAPIRTATLAAARCTFGQQWRTRRQTDRQTDRQADRETDRQTERQTERHRQIDTERETQRETQRQSRDTETQRQSRDSVETESQRQRHRDRVERGAGGQPGV